MQEGVEYRGTQPEAENRGTRPETRSLTCIPAPVLKMLILFCLYLKQHLLRKASISCKLSKLLIYTVFRLAKRVTKMKPASLLIVFLSVASALPVAPPISSSLKKRDSNLERAIRGEGPSKSRDIIWLGANPDETNKARDARAAEIVDDDSGWGGKKKPKARDIVWLDEGSAEPDGNDWFKKARDTIWGESPPETDGNDWIKKARDIVWGESPPETDGNDWIKKARDIVWNESPPETDGNDWIKRA
jgi:hypothetical protein